MTELRIDPQMQLTAGKRLPRTLIGFLKLLPQSVAACLDALDLPQIMAQMIVPTHPASLFMPCLTWL